MYTEKDLQQEISVIVNGRIAQEVIIPADAVALQICSNHIGSFRRGADAVAHGFWANTRKSVGNYLARLAKNDDGDVRQLRMDGFEMLQRYYVVNRESEDVAVPSRLLDYYECTSIMNRLSKESDAKKLHADEMRKFRNQRFPNGPTKGNADEETPAALSA